MPIRDKNMENYPWDKQESNISAEEWDTQQKWVQSFSHAKWLNCEHTDSMYMKVDGKGPGLFKIRSESERVMMSRPSKWNYDIGDSSDRVLH
jgi:hypothetical protein